MKNLWIFGGDHTVLDNSVFGSAKGLFKLRV